MDRHINNVLPDPEDERDYIFTATSNKLPSNIDLREYAEDIEDQKTTSSCVANATVSALELLLKKKGQFFNLSRLFLYYNLREPYTDLNEKDDGSYLRDGFKSVSNLGICSEDTWDFIVSKVNVRPSDLCYKEALQHMVQRYERIPGHSLVMSTKAALAKGYPVAVSMFVGNTFNYITGELHTHNYKGVCDDSIGGHALNVVGYNDDLSGFIVENSWGPSWGDKGYFLLKYDILVKDCFDAWVCTAFNGIVFEDEWEDNSPDIKLEKEHTIITNYKEDGRQFLGQINTVSGTPPYKFDWSLFHMYKNSGEFINLYDKSKILYTLNSDANTGAVVVKVEGGGPLKKTVTGYITFNYINTPNPNNIPEPSPDPVPPKPRPRPKDDESSDDDEDKRWYDYLLDWIKNVIREIF